MSMNDNLEKVINFLIGNIFCGFLAYTAFSDNFFVSESSYFYRGCYIENEYIRKAVEVLLAIPLSLISLYCGFYALFYFVKYLKSKIGKKVNQ